MINLESVLSFLAIIGIYLILYHAFSALFLESGRQKLFGIRDHIFDYVLDHNEKLPPESHKEIREFINRAILSLEYLTVPRVLVIALLHKKTESNYNVISSLYTSIEDKEAKDFIKASMKKVLSEIIKTMLLRAPLTSMLLVMFGLFIIALDAISPIQKRTKAKVESKFTNSVIDNLEHAPCV